ncbi:MAG: trp RNA-binding attenuation protein MtrB [Candidatus Carbobacillus altaicus]|nr:trp RNA-binding attenuation protein MtrB [Candidatus Carbobacillus altaicus]
MDEDKQSADTLFKTAFQPPYVVIRAKENGVQVIGMTRGESTRLHHTEKLDRHEVMIAQFTEHTSAIKVRGKATIYTAVGRIETDSPD